MANKKTVVAIIPARGGSKGIARKNLREIAGVPLVAYAIKAALDSPLITLTIVNTEDAEIRDVAIAHGAQIQNRPEDFWHDNTFQEVDRLLVWCVEDLERQGIKVDVVVLIYPTAPLRRTEHITQTVDLVVNKGFDSALTLREDRSYLWRLEKDGTTQPTNYDPKNRGPNQLEGWNQWIENKAVYAMTRDLLIDTGCRLGGKTGYIKMSRLESIDIDTPEDLKLAELLMDMRTNNV